MTMAPSNPKFLCQLLSLALIQHVSHGFVAVPRCAASLSSRSPPPSSFNRIEQTKIDAVVDGDSGVELVSLEALGDDHDTVGQAMADSVAAWLDAEWLPQEIHVKMGTSVKNTYVSCRNDGKEEVGEIMTQVTDDLYERWDEYNADAFVNAWDVGNYVADYLIAKSGSETCACSTTPVE